MKTIELNEQAVDYLIKMLNDAIESGEYGETNIAIMRHILSKLEE